MEGGRFLLAVILMIAVVVVTNLIFPPTPPAPLDMPVDSVPGATAPAGTTAAPTPPAFVPPDTLAADPDAPAATPTSGPADTVFVTSPLFRYGISTRGGALAVADLFLVSSGEGMSTLTMGGAGANP